MKKLILDFDSTLVKVETLDMLAEQVLRESESKDEIVVGIKKITELGMNGEIGFSESLQRRISLIKTNKEMIDKVGDMIKNEVSDSVLNNLDFFRNNQDNIFIISGGFKDLILPTIDIFKIPRENVLANEFIFDENGDLIGIDSENLMAQDNGKVNQLQRLNLGGKLIMVGDGWTDYQTKEAGVTDRFIAYTENVVREKVIQEADLVADNFKEVIDYFEKNLFN